MKRGDRMEYLLMNKDKAVLSLEMEDGMIISVNELFSAEYLPVGIYSDKKKELISALRKWWAGRRIPASRISFTEELAAISKYFDAPDDSAYLSEKCMGLSLSDQYWINPIDSPLKWSDINFFENDFSEDMGKILFDNAQIDNPDMMSPDNTSDGNLRKKWKIINGKRCLFKGYTLPYKQEPFNEKIASVICRELGIKSYVPYSLVFENNEPACVCDNFITPETEFVPANSVMSLKKRDSNTSLYNHYINICRDIGVTEISDRIDEMLVLDFLIGNYDRHFRNFGLIRNVETLEFVGAAPIFDNGTSLKFNTETNNIFIEPEYMLKSKPFKSTHHEQIRLVRNPERFKISGLRNCTDEIRDILETGGVTSAKRVDFLCDFLNQRITAINTALSKK